jgi:hypothetical protein
MRLEGKHYIAIKSLLAQEGFYNGLKPDPEDEGWDHVAQQAFNSFLLKHEGELVHLVGSQPSDDSQLGALMLKCLEGDLTIAEALKLRDNPEGQEGIQVKQEERKALKKAEGQVKVASGGASGAATGTDASTGGDSQPPQGEQPTEEQLRQRAAEQVDNLAAQSQNLGIEQVRAMEQAAGLPGSADTPPPAPPANQQGQAVRIKRGS